MLGCWDVGMLGSGFNSSAFRGFMFGGFMFVVLGLGVFVCSVGRGGGGRILHKIMTCVKLLILRR